MGKKIFEVYLAKKDVPNNEAYAKLDLPASPWELWDAMEKVRLKEGEQLYMEIEDYDALSISPPFGRVGYQPQRAQRPCRTACRHWTRCRKPPLRGCFPWRCREK